MNKRRSTMARTWSVLAIAICALHAGCGSNSTPADVGTPDRTDVASDGSKADAFISAGGYGEPCCKEAAGTCPYPACQSGLDCHILDGSTYIDRGYCTKKCTGGYCDVGPQAAYCGRDEYCEFWCRPSAYGCDASPCPPVGCPPGLTCRAKGEGELYFACMP